MSLLTEADKTSDSGKAAWLEKRKRHVTSTDVPILFGQGYYGSSVTGLWGYKKGKLPEVEETERMVIGRLIEPVVIQLYERATGRQVVKAAPWQLHVSEQYPFLGTSLDASDSEGVLLEIKNHDGYMDKVEDIPPGWYLQCQTEMLVLDRPLIRLVALCRGSRLVIHELEADTDVQREILDKAAAFYDLLRGTRPPRPQYAGDNKPMGRIWSPSKPDLTVDLYEEEYALIDALEAKKAEQKVLAEERDIIEGRIKDMLGYAELGIFPDHEGARVTWKADKKGTRRLHIRTGRE